MFLNGKIYEVLKASDAQRTAFDRLVLHQAEMFALLDAPRTLQSVQFLVSQLCPSFDQEITADNKDAILKAIRRHQVDPERAKIVDIRDARRAAGEEVSEAEEGPEDES